MSDQDEGRRRLLYVTDAVEGGVFDYVHQQANALVDAGVEVTVLCRPEFLSHAGRRYAVCAELVRRPARAGTRVGRAIAYYHDIRSTVARVDAVVRGERYRQVLMDCYREYLAPLWAGPLVRLARQGVVIGTVAHDPVRDHRVGPGWWHLRSVRAGYSFVRHVFVHGDGRMDFGGMAPAHLSVTRIPFPMYYVPVPVRTRDAVRAAMEIPSGARVFLSFGHLRNSKNLDLVLRAMVDLPEAWLLVVGGELGESQRPAAHYQALARELGVADRCRWVIGYIPGVEAAEYFAAADHALVTYSGEFRSASAALSVAAAHRVTSVASSGPGPMREQVERHGLGWWVEPDAVETIREGLRRALAGGVEPDWNGYASEHCWQRNVGGVVDALFGDDRDDMVLHCPAAHGGTAEHCHYQARALRGRGLRVRVLAPERYLEGRRVEYPVERVLEDWPEGGHGWGLRVRRAAAVVRMQRQLASHVRARRPRAAVQGAFLEYLAPFWAPALASARRATGTRMGANLHDPVRDYVVGPRWWHRWSVRLAFQALDFVVVHQKIRGAGVVPVGVAVHEAPVGVYDLTPMAVDRADVRRAWGVGDGDVVLLSFGYVRDNKNLDLLIRALGAQPGVHLVVAGEVASKAQKTQEDYLALAEREGVAARVHFVKGFVPDAQVASYFSAADFIALTYAGSYVSQSGVLNIAARARRPVLAASGPSPLQECVERFGLGVFVEPDSADALREGLRRLISTELKPDWEGYEAHASWQTNALVLALAAGLGARGVEGV
jgi:glycosyltransferase involved in cell wall biosynthesis